MNRRTLVTKLPLLVPVLCLALTSVGAETDRASFAYMQELHGPKSPGYYALALPREVFAYCNTRELWDLRVLDGQNREIPYVLLPPREYSARVSAVPAPVRNLAYLPGVGTRFEIQRAADAPLLKALTVSSSLRGYCYRATVEGSRDRRQWAILRQKATLYSLDGDSPARGELITFPPTDFPYLRVTIFSGKRKFPVTSVSVDPELRSAWPMRLVRSGPMSVNLFPEQKTTEVTVDLGLPNQPVDAVELQFRDRNVMRWCDLQFRNSSDAPWLPGATHQALFRYQTRTLSGEQNRFPGPAGGTRYLKLIIHNGDDTPLEVKGMRVYAHPWLLVTKWTPNSGQRLYFGAAEPRAPQYDLDEYLRREYPDERAGRKRWLAGLTVGELQRNPAHLERRPWIEDQPWLIYLTLGLGVIVLGIILWRTMRRVAEPPDAAPPTGF